MTSLTPPTRLTRLTRAEVECFGIHEEGIRWAGACPRPDCSYRFLGDPMPGAFSLTGHTSQAEVVRAVVQHYLGAHL